MLPPVPPPAPPLASQSNTSQWLPYLGQDEDVNAPVTRILELTNDAGETHEIRYVGSQDVLDYLSMLVANIAWKPQRRWWQFWR